MILNDFPAGMILESPVRVKCILNQHPASGIRFSKQQQGKYMKMLKETQVKKWLVLLLGACLTLGWAGCSNSQSDSEDVADDTVEVMEDAAEEAADAVEDAAEDAEEAVEDAAEDSDDAY
jgi:hypothetical protein